MMDGATGWSPSSSDVGMGQEVAPWTNDPWDRDGGGMGAVPRRVKVSMPGRGITSQGVGTPMGIDAQVGSVFGEFCKSAFCKMCVKIKEKTTVREVNRSKILLFG